MSIIGEPIIGSTAKNIEAKNESKERKQSKNQRMKSLDSKLPRLKDENYKDFVNGIIPLSNKNLKLPVLSSQNYPPGLAVYDSQNKLKSNLKYRLQSSNRYKNLPNEYSVIHKNYLNKNAKSTKKVKILNRNKKDKSPKEINKGKCNSCYISFSLYFSIWLA